MGADGDENHRLRLLLPLPREKNPAIVATTARTEARQITAELVRFQSAIHRVRGESCQSLVHATTPVFIALGVTGVGAAEPWGENEFWHGIGITAPRRRVDGGASALFRLVPP